MTSKILSHQKLFVSSHAMNNNEIQKITITDSTDMAELAKSIRLARVLKLKNECRRDHRLVIDDEAILLPEIVTLSNFRYSDIVKFKYDQVVSLTLMYLSLKNCAEISWPPRPLPNLKEINVFIYANWGRHCPILYMNTNNLPALEKLHVVYYDGQMDTVVVGKHMRKLNLFCGIKTFVVHPEFDAKNLNTLMIASLHLPQTALKNFAMACNNLELIVICCELFDKELAVFCLKQRMSIRLSYRDCCSIMTLEDKRVTFHMEFFVPKMLSYGSTSKFIEFVLDNCDVDELYIHTFNKFIIRLPPRTFKILNMPECVTRYHRLLP